MHAKTHKVENNLLKCYFTFPFPLCLVILLPNNLSPTHVNDENVYNRVPLSHTATLGTALTQLLSDVSAKSREGFYRHLSLLRGDDVFFTIGEMYLLC